MTNFWDFSVWGGVILIAVLLICLLIGNILRRNVPLLKRSLIPASVLGGIVMLIISEIYKLITGDKFLESACFGGNGTDVLEMVTYHALALGFIASTLKSTGGKLTQQRTTEIFNTGVTTVSSYLIQAVLGFGITLLASATIMKSLFPASGILLPFGYGQGTGQAMNYGSIYETDYGFVGGKSFGLTVAAMGFISAAIGGVIHLSFMKKKGLLKPQTEGGSAQLETVHSDDEIPMQESVDKLTVQLSFIAISYFCAYGLMYILGELLPGMKSVVYGFNFLFGVIAATVTKLIVNLLSKKGWMKKKYTNNFLLTRVSNLFFDIMIVAGIGAIRLEAMKDYWVILLILGIVGAVSTYWYNSFVVNKLFKGYREEQFLVMYGMLTGTASTGIMLLREVDGDFRTPAADNLVYQNFPAMVFGFPMMLLATMAPVKPVLTFVILVVFFIAMNIILFRSFIFKKRKSAE